MEIEIIMEAETPQTPQIAIDPPNPTDWDDLYGFAQALRFFLPVGLRYTN